MYGRNISMLRKKHNLTQRQLAKILNISYGTLGMYETEKREPDLETIEEIADYFNVDISFIVTGKMSSDNDPLLERIRNLSPDSRVEIEKFAALLELKEKQEEQPEEFEV